MSMWTWLLDIHFEHLRFWPYFALATISYASGWSTFGRGCLTGLNTSSWIRWKQECKAIFRNFIGTDTTRWVILNSASIEFLALRRLTANAARGSGMAPMRLGKPPDQWDQACGQIHLTTIFNSGTGKNILESVSISIRQCKLATDNMTCRQSTEAPLSFSHLLEK